MLKLVEVTLKLSALVVQMDKKMKIFSSLKYLLSIVLLTGIGYASAESPVAAQVKQRYNSGSTLQTQFTLEMYWSVREKTDKKQGQLWLAPGNKFKAILGNETYVSNGESFWQYSQKSNQVVIKNLSQVDVNSLPSSLFSNFVTKYSFKQSGTSNGVTALIWKANDNESGPFTSITLWVESKSGIIKTICCEDSNKNISTYTFTKTVTGKTISREVFQFEPPKSARIVDMRE